MQQCVREAVEPMRLASRLRIALCLVSMFPALADRKSTRLNSSHGYISYAVFCLKKKKKLIQLDAPFPPLRVYRIEDVNHCVCHRRAVVWSRSYSRFDSLIDYSRTLSLARVYRH